MRHVRHVKIDREALTKAGASSVLALDPMAMGGTVALAAEPPGEEVERQAPKVALVRIEGPLAQKAMVDLCAYVDGYDAVAARFAKALASDATGVVLVIDSPGGDVAGLEEAVAYMRRLKADAGKPVVAYVDELAASAAYWIAACVADQVVVPGAGRVGSIGCIGAYVDQSKAFADAGIAWTVVREPAGKADMMPAAPVHEVAMARLTESVRSSAERFYGAIQGARSIDAKGIQKMNGALFQGDKAVANKLADRVGSLEDAVAIAAVQAPRPAKNEAARVAAPKGNRMKLHTIVVAALGLAQDAPDEEAVSAFESLRNDLIASSGAKSIGSVAATIDSLKLTNDSLSEKASKFDALDAKQKQDAKVREAAELEALIEQAGTAGKLTPAKREEFTAKAQKHGIDWARDTIEMLPVQGSAPTGDAGLKGPDADPDRLNAEVKQALLKSGQTEDQYHAARLAGVV